MCHRATHHFEAPRTVMIRCRRSAIAVLGRPPMPQFGWIARRSRLASDTPTNGTSPLGPTVGHHAVLKKESSLPAAGPVLIRELTADRWRAHRICGCRSSDEVNLELVIGKPEVKPAPCECGNQDHCQHKQESAYLSPSPSPPGRMGSSIERHIDGQPHSDYVGK